MENDFRGWIPTRFRCEQQGILVDWRFLGNRRFIEPFFEDTLRAALTEGMPQTRTTPVESLRDCASDQDTVTPTGFIFHWSRCGSTLVSQMLAGAASNRVISEAPPIEGILRANLSLPGLSQNDQILWLRWMISALGRRGSRAERHLFIKFDSWQTLDLELIQRAFPATPWVFVYRDPGEIMVSHQRRRGSHMVPGLIDSAIFGWERSVIVKMNFDLYGARVLATVADAVLRHFDPSRCRLIHYTELPQGVLSSLVPFFGAEFSNEDIDLMEAAAVQDAKAPAQVFVADREKKRAQISEELQCLMDDIVMPVYERLEALRMAQVKT